MKVVSYIFVHIGPLHTMMLQSCYPSLPTVCYADVRSRFAIGPLALFTFFGRETNSTYICVAVLFPYIPVINHTLCIS